MSKASIKILKDQISAHMDLNEDGEPSLSLKVHMSESLQEAIEAFKKGEKKTVEVDAKKVAFTFDPLKGMSLAIDTDQDGEKSVELDLSLIEAVDEAGSLFKKD